MYPDISARRFDISGECPIPWELFTLYFKGRAGLIHNEKNLWNTIIISLKKSLAYTSYRKFKALKILMVISVCQVWQSNVINGWFLYEVPPLCYQRNTIKRFILNGSKQVVVLKFVRKI